MGNTLLWPDFVKKLGLTVILALALPAMAANVKLVRTSPEVRQAPPGGVITHIFAVYGSGSYTPSFTSEHSWPILSSERPLQLDPEKAAYLAVSVRVPAGAREGEKDRLTVRVGDAESFAYTQAAFQPGFQASWPRTIDYLPPVGYLPLSLRNTGNGPDTYLIRVETLEREPVFSKRVVLEAGQALELRIPINAYDTYKVTVTSLRSRQKQEGLVVVNPASGRSGGNFRLIGHATAAYSYPGSLSFGAGLAGPLSDFAYLNFGIGYALGGIPAGSATVSFDGGYFSVVFGSSYGMALGFQESGVAVDMSLSGPEPRGSLDVNFSTERASCGFSASLNRDPSFRLVTQIGLRAQSRDLITALQSDNLRAELNFAPLESRVFGEVSYGFHYRELPLRLTYGADWHSGEPVVNTISADANPTEASFGGRISWTGLGLEDWNLAFASNDKRLQIESPLPFYVGASAGPDRARVFAGTKVDLPQPWSDLAGQVEAEYASGSWSFTVSGSSVASSFEGMTLWDVGGKLGWPLSENQISLGVRAGSSYLRGRASLDWAPWSPSLGTFLGLEAPVGGVLLQASLGREWYGGATTFSLSADAPMVIEVPPSVTDFFGGRRVGVVAGVVEVDGPPRFRRGIPVKAGGEVALTDEEGRFELLLPPGEYTVEVDRGRLPAVLVAVKGEEKVTVRLKEKIEVKLKVAVRSSLVGKVAVVGQKPSSIPRFAIAIEDEKGRQTSLYTNSDGAFRLDGLPPGMYTIRLLAEFLPPGWKAIKPEATVLLQPGETAEVELEAAPPERKVYRGGLQILSVEPEAKSFPPGARPLVTVRLKGKADRVLLEAGGKVVGVLLPAGEEGLWRGRVRLPDDYEGPLQLRVVARAGDEEARFPFFVSLSKNAPWGQLRVVPVAKPGQELAVAVHWYKPVRECWVKVGDERFALDGDAADWRGKVILPQEIAGKRLSLRAIGLDGDGKQLEIVRWILIRQE